MTAEKVPRFARDEVPSALPPFRPPRGNLPPPADILPFHHHIRRNPRGWSGERASGGRHAPDPELEAVGPLPRRAAVGNGAGGLLGIRRLLELPAARPRAKPRIPMG